MYEPSPPASAFSASSVKTSAVPSVAQSRVSEEFAGSTDEPREAKEALTAAAEFRARAEFEKLAQQGFMILSTLLEDRYEVFASEAGATNYQLMALEGTIPTKSIASQTVCICLLR